MHSRQPLSLVVLISGNGSNLQAIIDAIAAGRLHARIAAVISNRPDAAGLQRARAAGIAVETIDHKTFPDRESFDDALAQVIDGYRPELIVLAGFMRILTPKFVDRFAGRMINIHPSLLPRFQGLNTHQRAIEAGESEHGASIHFVTTELDGGPVIAQTRVPVLADDDAAALAARVLTREHILFPQVLTWFAERRIRLQDNTVLLDGELLSRPVEV